MKFFDNKFRLLKIILTVLILFLLSFQKNKTNNKFQLNHTPKILFITPSSIVKLTQSESNDILSQKNCLMVVGFDVTEIETSTVEKQNLEIFDMVFVPNASAKNLNPVEIKILVAAIKKGLLLFTDSLSNLSESLNVKLLPKQIKVNQVCDNNFTEKNLTWSKQVTVNPIDINKTNFTVLSKDKVSGEALSVIGKVGQGQFLFIAPLFDPVTDKGYTRFPFLIETLNLFFGLTPIVERNATEVYFDFGMRDENFDIDSLVHQWRLHRIKCIYASGWYYDQNYDYAHLINACHQNGILIYCWTEIPMVSRDFWKNHPEWREKTAYQQDAIIDWRSLMNVADTACRKQVMKDYNEFLTKLDWDGVDFAEMYFEPTDGIELTKNFTPVNDFVRKEFKTQAGFDPILLFDEHSEHYWKNNAKDVRTFLDYRKNLCYQIKKSFIELFLTLKKQKPDFEVILTVLDVSLTPAVADNVAENTEYSLALQKDYNITLQEQDPSNSWGSTPDRYNKLGALYRQSIKTEHQLIFDCNIVEAHENGYGGFPLVIPSGEEIRQIAYNMDTYNARTAFYSEDGISDLDYKNISNVLARKTQIQELSDDNWLVNSSTMVIINCSENDLEIKLDNKIWLAKENGNVIVPAGKHDLKFSNPIKNSEQYLKLVSISGELLNANFSNKTIEFSYSEPINSCFVGVNQKPKNILVDGKEMNCAVYAKDLTLFTIKLPKGKHRVIVKS